MRTRFTNDLQSQTGWMYLICFFNSSLSEEVLGSITWCTFYVYCSYFSGFFIERMRIVCIYISIQLQLTMLNKIIQFGVT